MCGKLLADLLNVSILVVLQYDNNPVGSYLVIIIINLKIDIKQMLKNLNLVNLRNTHKQSEK